MASKPNRMGTWLQAAGNLAVVAGLVLLAVEINQNSRLIRAQIQAEQTAGWIDIDASKQSENFAETLAKAIEAPQDLTVAEMVELDGYLFTYIDQLLMHRNAFSLGLAQQPLDSLISGSLYDFMGNRYAHAWWAETKWKFNAEVVRGIDAALRGVEPTQDLEYYLRIRARLRADN